MTRWTRDRCIEHRGQPTVAKFFQDYFSDGSRSVLMVAGGGFDPRSTLVAAELAPVLGKRLTALLLREDRPSPSSKMASDAQANIENLAALVPDHRVESVAVFGDDDAVVLGRNTIRVARGIELSDVTDVVVDFSALSIGASFPLTKFFLELEGPNVHVVVAADSRIDERIIPTLTTTVASPFGFRGRLGIDETAEAARLWLPTLAERKRHMLRQIHESLEPHDVAPIVPFPSAAPRHGDAMLEAFSDELDGSWDVDARNLIYAAENNPLDLYRTLLRIDDHRHPVFEHVGGSLLIVSPVGTKVLAIGAMMAALERDFPIAYVETVGYGLELGMQELGNPPSFVHVWLYGDAYRP